MATMMPYSDNYICGKASQRNARRSQIQSTACFSVSRACLVKTLFTNESDVD